LILGPDAGPIPLGSSAMTQAPSVPKWAWAWLTLKAAQAPHVCVETQIFYQSNFTMCYFVL